MAYIVATFILKGISFFTTPVFTRLMGAEDFGIVSNFNTWASFFAIFICLQTSSGMMSAKATYAADRFDGYLKNICFFSILSSFVFLFIIFFLRNYIGKWIEIDSLYVLLMFPVALGQCATNIYSDYCLSLQKAKQKVVFSLISSLLITSLGIIFVVANEDKSAGRIMGYTISYSMIAFFVFSSFLRHPFSDSKVLKKDIGFALRFGLPLIPHLLANLINGNADRVFIIKLWGANEAGVYSVAYNIGALSLTFVDACTGAWNPWYFNETKKEPNGGEIKKYFYLYSCTIAMCFFGVMLLSTEIMKLMASKEYWLGIGCIKYVAIGIFALFMYRFPLAYEQLYANTKFVAPATIVAAFLNIFLNSILIPKHGINGAAIATSISYFLLWSFHELVSRFLIKRYNIKLSWCLLPTMIVCAGFILTSIFQYIFWARIIIVIIACVIYLVFLGKNTNFLSGLKETWRK